LRSFFGVFYIIIPHIMLLVFYFLAAQIASIYSALHILLRGTFPPAVFHFQEKVMFWAVRLHARIYHMCDTYPPIGLDVIDNKVFFEWDFPENIERKAVLKRFLFAWFYVFIPHILVFAFQAMFASILLIVTFFSILIKGKYPKKWHDFQLQLLSKLVRVYAYMWYIEHNYPSFSINQHKLV
jgi:hypothetical protein